MISGRVLLDRAKEHRAYVVCGRLKEIAKEQKVVLNIAELACARNELKNRGQPANQLYLLVGILWRSSSLRGFAAFVLRAAPHEVGHPSGELPRGALARGLRGSLIARRTGTHQFAEVELAHSHPAHELRHAVECDHSAV